MSEPKIVMSIDEARASAAGLRVPLEFETPGGRNAYATEDGYVRVDPNVEESAGLRITEDHGASWCGRPAATKGSLDWNAIPNRILMDPPETKQLSILRYLVKAFGLAVVPVFVLVCAVLGAFLIARAVHDAIASGWSWAVVFESISDRLGPA